MLCGTNALQDTMDLEFSSNSSHLKVKTVYERLLEAF